MRKIREIEEFLDYGGNQLLSSLMNDESDRPQALDRLCQLLNKYSDAFWVKGRAGAYRYLIAQANMLGFIKSKELNRFFLTKLERERVLKKLLEYEKSGGKTRKIMVRTVEVIIGILVIILAFYLVNCWIHSEEYQRRLLGTVAENVNNVIYYMNI